MLTMTEKKRGRKPEPNPMVAQVSVRLTPELAERLERYRGRMRPPPRHSDVLRLALEDFLDAAEREEKAD